MDLILREVAVRAGDRKCYFSSFHPDLVVLLRHKQTKYAVLFIYHGDMSLYAENYAGLFLEKRTLEEARQFVLKEDLSGLVVNGDLLADNPAFCALSPFPVLCYGKMTNDAAGIQKLIEYGVTGIITDHGRLVRQSLRQALKQPAKSDFEDLSIQ